MSAEEVVDHDDVIAKNLNSPNGLVVIFTIAKLIKIMKPYIDHKQLSYFDKNLFNSFYSAKSLEDKFPSSLLGFTTNTKRVPDIDVSRTNIDIEDLASMF